MVTAEISPHTEAILETWKDFGKHPHHHNPEYIAFCVRRQADEYLEKTKGNAPAWTEMADLVILAELVIHLNGKDPDKAVIERLSYRHAGRQKEILEKYAKLWKEYRKE